MKMCNHTQENLERAMSPATIKDRWIRFAQLQVGLAFFAFVLRGETQLTVGLI